VGEKASELGESALIQRLLAPIRPMSSGEWEFGPGDDAASLTLTTPVLATTDLLIEGTHFDLEISTFEDVGWKALAVNVSDIAAMGGHPRYALIGLGAPADAAVADLERVYAGFEECAMEFHVHIAGGDSVRADRLTLALTVLGEAPTAPVRRNGASVGDVVCVTGAVGAASAGLALLRGVERGDAGATELLERFPSLAAAHRRPGPRVAEGQKAASAGATAMIDVSDGLGRDLNHICLASGTGARIIRSAIPFAEGVAEVAAWRGVDPIEFAVGGGDDYELLITVKLKHLDRLTAAIAPTPLTRIGDVTDGDRVTMVNGSAEMDLSRFGWDPFREDA